MRGTLSAWFLHGVCQHETRRHDVSRLRFGINARVGGKSVASRAEMQMQYGQYGRGDTVSFVGSRLSPPRVSVTRHFPVAARGGLVTDTSYVVPRAGGHAIKLLSAAWYFSDFVERYRATDHEHDKYMEDGTDTHNERELRHHMYGIRVFPVQFTIRVACRLERRRRERRQSRLRCRDRTVARAHSWLQAAWHSGNAQTGRCCQTSGGASSWASPSPCAGGLLAPAKAGHVAL